MRRRAGLIAAVALSVVAAVGLAVVIGPALVPAPWLGERLAAALQPHLAAPVEVGSARFGLLWGFVVEDVRVGPPDGYEADVLRASRVELHHRPWPLLLGRFEIDRLEIEAPRVALEVHASGAWNVQRLLPPPPTDPATGAASPTRVPIAVALRRLIVSDLRFELRGPDARLGSGPVEIRGRASAEATRLDGTLRVSAHPDERGVLDDRPIAVTGHGTLTATAAYDFAQPWSRALLRAGWRHDLRLDWPVFGAALDTEVALSARLNPDADVAELRIERLAAGSSSRLRARARLHPVSAWSTPIGRASTLEVWADGVADLGETLGRVDAVERAAGTLRFEDAQGTLTGRPPMVVPSSGRGSVHADDLALKMSGVDVQLDRGRLTASGDAARLAAALELRGLGLRTAALGLHRADVELAATVHGIRPRPEGAVTATVTAARVRAAGFEASQAALELRASAEGRDAQSASVEASARRVAVSDRRVEALRVSAEVRGRGQRVSAASARLAVDRFESGDLDLTGAAVSSSVRALSDDAGSDLQLGPVTVPGRADVRVQGTARAARVPVGEGALTSSLAIAAAGRVDLLRSRIRGLEATVTTGLGVEVRAEGDAATPGPWTLAGRAQVRDAEGLLAALPAGIVPQGVAADGEVGLEAQLDVPRGDGGPDFERASGEVVLALEGLDLFAGEIAGRGLRGRVRGRVDGSRARGVGWSLEAERLTAASDGGSFDALTTTGTAVLTRAGVRLTAAAQVGPGSSRLASFDLSRGAARVDVWHPRGGGLEIRRAELRLPALGLQGGLQGRLRPGMFGAWSPDLVLTATVSGARSSELVGGIRSGRGLGATSVTIRPVATDRFELAGTLAADDLSLEGRSWRVEGATGRFPLRQSFEVEPPRFSAEVAAARGAFDDDFEARLAELADRLAGARLLLGARDIRVDSPVTADYQALRPYGDPPAPDATAERLVLGQTELDDVVFEADWHAGLLSVRRLAFSVWQGDVLLDAVAQVSPDRDLRVRTRGTATHVNLDIPYARVEGREPRLDEAGEGPYRTSAVLDLRFGLRDRQLDGTIDLQRVTKKLLERAFGALELESARSALKWLELSERFGVRPTKGKIWISNNLLSAEFDWQRLWIHVAYRSAAPWDVIVDTFFIVGRIATVPTVGASIINIVNSAVRRFSIGNIIDRSVSESGVLGLLGRMDPYLAAPAEAP